MFQDVLFLLKSGVPWELINSWSTARRIAAVVALREMQGDVFDWDTMQIAPREAYV